MLGDPCGLELPSLAALLLQGGGKRTDLKRGHFIDYVFIYRQ